MDEIRLLSAVLNLLASAFNLMRFIIDSRKRKKPSPSCPEKVSKYLKEKG